MPITTVTRTKVVKYADGKTVEFEYDTLGNLIKMRDWLGETNIENDEYGRAVRISDYNKNVVGFEYGKKGEKKAVVYPDGEKVDFRHDEYGRLIQVDTSAGVINYIYDNSGQIKKKRFPGNVWVDYTYDRAGRVSEFTSTDATGAVDNFMYEYDAVGNKVRICKRRKGMSALSGDYHYSYDSLNRLIEVEKDGKLLRSYSYDGYGNRTYMSEEGEEFFYTYNVLNQLLTVEGSESKRYSYDKKGNLISQGVDGEVVTTYTYDSTNRLVNIQQEGGKCSQYSYNGLGHRVKQERKNRKEVGIFSNDEQEEYFIDLTKGYNNVLYEKNGKKTPKYIWSDVLLGIKDERVGEFALTDDTNTPIRFFFGNGVISTSSDYDEFGNLQYGKWDDGQPFGFTGYRKEGLDSQYFGQAREYHAVEGRFVNEDIYGGRLEIPSSLNRYIYCYQNPLIFLDPLGYFTIEEGNDAHKELQKYVKERYPNVSIEYPVTGYKHNDSGKGRVDIIFWGADGAEVYEIKTVVQRYYDIGYELLNEEERQGMRISGPEQRRGYIDALKSMDKLVPPMASLFNPNYLELPSSLYPDKMIRYYTYPELEGMIYWTYVNKPKSEPEAITVKEKENESIWEKVKDNAEAVGTGLAFIAGILWWIYANVNGVPVPAPTFAEATCNNNTMV